MFVYSLHIHAHLSCACVCMHVCVHTYSVLAFYICTHIHSYVYLFSLWSSLDKRHLPRAEVVEPVRKRRGVGIDKVLVPVLFCMRWHNLRRPAAAEVFLPPCLWSDRRTGPEDLDAEAPKEEASLPRAFHHGVQRGVEDCATNVEADPHVLRHRCLVRHQKTLRSVLATLRSLRCPRSDREEMESLAGARKYRNYRLFIIVRTCSGSFSITTSPGSCLSASALKVM